ncbi:MAG: helix-turn-helix domain-containing protein [Mangrovibacterium sp.]
MNETSKEKLESEVKKILENIKAIRLSMNLGQEKIASQLGMDTSTYSKIENGKIELTAFRLAQLASQFSMTIVDIINWPEKWVPAFQRQDIPEPKVTLQIELSKEKKDQVLKLAFGENILEILNK